MYEVELLTKKNKELITRSVTEINFKFHWKAYMDTIEKILFKEDCIVFKKDDILIRSIELRKYDYNVYCC